MQEKRKQGGSFSYKGKAQEVYRQIFWWEGLYNTREEFQELWHFPFRIWLKQELFSASSLYKEVEGPDTTQGDIKKTGIPSKCLKKDNCKSKSLWQILS